MQPLVSLAIPAYKINYLDKAIESALRQTHSNIEVLVVDDCSPNDIKSVVDSYSDSRLKYYRNEYNLGGRNPAANWNRCVDLAHGDFFCLLCDDDWYEPDFVDTLLLLAEKYPSCNVFRSGADLRNADDLLTDRYPSSPEWESMEDYVWHVAKKFRRQTISEWMYRTETIREFKYAMLPLAWYADYLSVFRMSKDGGIASSSKTLMHFRQSGINISSLDSENTIEKLQAKCRYFEEIKSLLANNENSDFVLNALSELLAGHVKYSLKHAHKLTLLRLLPDYRKYDIKLGWLFHALKHI